MDQLRQFSIYLTEQERSPLTVEKYLRDTEKFLRWLSGRSLTRQEVLAYKASLLAAYSPASVNSMLSALNCYLRFLDRRECCVRIVRVQQQAFSSKAKELSRKEYRQLLIQARSDRRLYLLMQAICATGIRVSEHRYLTVEAARAGRTDVRCKGKIRTVWIPAKLCRALLDYARQKHIPSGPIFITRSGAPLDRSRIWRQMKQLCTAAGVSPEKVFPHNLRHLFARIYYSMEKDIVRLADILGHTSINTTRIYTRESGEVHRRQIEKMPLLFIT